MLGLRITKRHNALGFEGLIIFCISFACALLIGTMLLAIQDKPMFEGIKLLLLGGFGSLVALEDTILKAIPLFLCSLGVAVAFRMQIWNIGAEGQFALGAIGATWFALTFPNAPMYIMLPAMGLCAVIAGGIWCFISGLLLLKFNINEIISTLMLNYIGISFLDYLVYGSWKDPGGFGFPMTAIFPDNAIMPILFSRIHLGIVICIILATALMIFLRYTRLGFELMVSGENPQAAKSARMPYNFLVLFVMFISGALVGIAGAIEASATLNRLQPSIIVGYGYTAIVVAWLSRLKILSIGFYAIFLAGLRVGVENLQIDLGVPASFAGILEGTILLTMLAGQFFNHYSFQRTQKTRHKL